MTFDGHLKWGRNGARTFDGHCIVCSSPFLLPIVLSVLLFFFWPLYCLPFSFSFAHCIVCSSLFLWPLYCLPFSFSFAHCIVCPSIYDFLLLLCYLQTFLPRVIKYNCKDYKSARTKVALKIFRRSVNMIDHTTILRPLRIRNNKDIIFEILLV